MIQVMKEFVRYRIELGPRCMFDANTHVDALIESSYATSGTPLNDLLIGDTDDNGYIAKVASISNVTPNQVLTFYGLTIKVPSDASKMVKWEETSIKSVLVLFLKSNNTLVDNAFAYQICMDNEIELEELEEQENT